MVLHTQQFLANIISAISCWTILWRKTEAIHPDAEALKPDKEAAKLILKIGIPATLQSSTMTIGALLIQTMINDFTTPTLPIMAAFAAATKVEQLIAYPPGGVSDGMQTFAGQNVGAGKFDRVGKDWHPVLRLLQFIRFSLPAFWDLADVS